jgi:uncharacterized membrane protein HdeD (DUF308 family)
MRHLGDSQPFTEVIQMGDLIKRSWWMLALRGALAVAFGVLAVLWPDATLLLLVALFAAWMLLSGAAATYASLKYRRADKAWWLVLLLGLVSFAAGVIAVLDPHMTILALVLLMGANALVTGALEIVMAVRLRKVIEREWLLALAGAVSVAFGVLVVLFPAAGALALVWLVSFYAVVTGALLLTLAFRARNWSAQGRSSIDHVRNVGRHAT